MIFQFSGKVKNIGVSNFLQHHIQELIDKTGVCPDVIQVKNRNTLMYVNSFILDIKTAFFWTSSYIHGI